MEVTGVKEIVKKAKYVPSRIFHLIFRKTIWNSRVEKVLFTFDDGPNPETTPMILEKLKENSIKAVFFCVGENVKRYPELAKRIVNEGHEIGNHTISHQNINLLNRNASNSIIKCSDTIEKIVGVRPNYFRPPHGKIGLLTERILKKHSLKNVMWSLLTCDYKNDINIVRFTVEKYLKKNSIIVLHDSLKSKSIIAESIDIIVEKVETNEFVIGEPAECLK
jgi:peptidoglycan-N-acetylglucosamine deacetylase